MIRLHILSFWINLLLCSQITQSKPFGSFSTNRRNVPANLLASVSFEMDDIDELLVAPSFSTTKKSPGLDWQAAAESIVKSVAAVLFARCLFALTGNRNQNDTETTITTKSEEESLDASSSLSSFPPLSSTAEWKEIIERVNYLQATLHEYYELWNRQMDEHDTGMNTGWVTCMEVAEQNAHVIHELNAKLEDLRNQIQGSVAQVSEETIVETTTTVEQEEAPPVSEQELEE